MTYLTRNNATLFYQIEEGAANPSGLQTTIQRRFHNTNYIGVPKKKKKKHKKKKKKYHRRNRPPPPNALAASQRSIVPERSERPGELRAQRERVRRCPHVRPPPLLNLRMLSKRIQPLPLSLPNGP